MRLALTDELDVCPFIDAGHPLCAAHFTVDCLYEAMTDCIDGYQGCGHYWRLLHGGTHPALIALTSLTLHGRPLAATG